MLAGCGQQADPQPEQPTKVQAVTIEPRKLSLERTLPGRVEPVRVAEVRARVAGIVLKRNFVEGADVKAGQVLFQIDPAPFKAALSRATGELARADAQHFEAQALVKRYQPLVKIGAVSPQDYDSALAALRVAQAAQVAAKASVETAQLELNYATVTAPISGRVGRALVTEGALVGQGEATALAIVQQIDTVYVDFTQPAAEVLNIRQAMRDGQASASENEIGKVQVTLEGSGHKAEGRLLFSDISVDRGTGQLSLRGELENRDHTLLPGMYVRVTIGQGDDPAAILVPQRAVKRTPDGNAQVLVIDQEDVARAQPVSTGQMYGSEWHILEGLKPGDRVVVGGNPSAGQKVEIEQSNANEEAK